MENGVYFWSPLIHSNFCVFPVTPVLSQTVPDQLSQPVEIHPADRNGIFIYRELCIVHRT